AQVLRAQADRRASERVVRRGQRGERRADHGVDVRQRQRARAHVRDERARLRDRLVHLPVPDDERLARAHGYRSSAATPGSVLPSRNSSVAPPPVETCVIASAKPSACAAAAASPPPTTLVAPCRVASAIASPTTRVPFRYGGFSYTPIGPLNTMVIALRSTSAYARAVSGPMSRISASPTRSSGTVRAVS